MVRSLGVGVCPAARLANGETVPASGACVRVSSLAEAALLLGLDRSDVAAYRVWYERGSVFQAPVLERRAS
jgi:hypothetical protein